MRDIVLREEDSLVPAELPCHARNSEHGRNIEYALASLRRRVQRRRDGGGLAVTHIVTGINKLRFKSLSSASTTASRRRFNGRTKILDRIIVITRSLGRGNATLLPFNFICARFQRTRLSSLFSSWGNCSSTRVTPLAKTSFVPYQWGNNNCHYARSSIQHEDNDSCQYLQSVFIFFKFVIENFLKI